jgi:hypothetical protein
MARPRAVIKTPYPSVATVAKALGVSKQRTRQISLMVDHLMASNGKSEEWIYRAFRTGRLKTSAKHPPKRRSKT